MPGGAPRSRGWPLLLGNGRVLLDSRYLTRVAWPPAPLYGVKNRGHGDERAPDQERLPTGKRDDGRAWNGAPGWRSPEFLLLPPHRYVPLGLLAGAHPACKHGAMYEVHTFRIYITHNYGM